MTLKPKHPVLVALICCLALSNVAQTQSLPRNVLVINSYHQALPWTHAFNERLIHSAQLDSEHQWQLYFENLDATRIGGLTDLQFSDLLQTKYAHIEFDAVIAESAPAATFAERQKHAFNWPIRIQFNSALESEDTHALYFGNNDSYYVDKTLDMMLAQSPATQSLYLIEAGGPPDRQLIGLVSDYLSHYPSIRLVIEREFTIPELLQRVANYSADSLVLYGAVFKDREGKAQIPRDVLKEVAAVSPVPVYGLYSTFLDTGMVGGHLSDPEVTAESSLQAIRDYVETGRFRKVYPATQSILDVTVANKFHLPLSVDGMNPVLRNVRDPWLQRNVEHISWIILILSSTTMLSVFWAARVRVINAKLSISHQKLHVAKQQLIEKNKYLKQQSMKDPLTGLFNRRAFLPKLEEAMAEFQRYGNKSTIMLIDLDDFKQINDQYGHNIGDTLLKSFSYLLQAQSRRSDIIARWGGEEFLILAKGIGEQEAYLYLDNIRQRVQAAQEIDGRVISFSAGICEIADHNTVELLIAEADAAMYRAKNSGKNCTVIATANQLF